MLKTVSIENFRGLRKLAIHGLKRVNLIVGANSTGKTSVLEAIYLLATGSSPERASNPFRSSAPNTIDSARWLFPHQNSRQAIRIVGTPERGPTRRLSVRITKKLPARMRYPKEVHDGANPTSSAARSLGLELAYEIGKKKFTALQYIESDFQLFESTAAMPFSPSNFVPAGNRTVDLKLLSIALEANQEKWIVDSLAQIAPDLVGLRILVPDGVPEVFAVFGSRESPIPVRLIGDGAQRALTILVATHLSRSGCTLIDEFENGLGYRAMLSTWKATFQAARMSDAQLFCTTHSYECLAAAVEAVGTGDHSDDLAIHRLERDGDDLNVVTITADEATAMIRKNFELR